MSSIIKGLRKEGYSAGAVGGAGLEESNDRTYQLEDALKQATQITNLIKYDDTTTDIIVKIQTLADKYQIDKQELERKIDNVIQANNRLESIVFDLVEPFENALKNEKMKGDEFAEGQIYSTGGGAGQAYRKFTPKSSVMSGIKETITDPEFDQKIKNITAMNPIGSAAEKMILKSFLKNVNLPKDIDQDEWIDSMRQYLIQNREVFKDTFPELDFTDLDHMAQDLYVNHLYSKKQLEQVEVKKESSIMKGIQKEADLKKSKELTNLDKEINDMIEKIWHTEKPEMFQDSGRYLVYASDMGVEMDTDKLDDALDTAEIIAKRNIRSPVVVVDRKTKFPVVAFHGSESLWYHQNRLHEEELVLEKWSKKYKKSINCSNPKGFSQKAHCAGRKARQSGKQTKSKSISK